MRIVLALAIVAALGTILSSPAGWEYQQPGVAIYDPNPDHLWNRMHATFFVRGDFAARQRLPDAVDPPLWYHTSYLLSNPSHKQALQVLDEFLQTHAENLIRDPIKRAILQRDLWAVFDWAVNGRPKHARDAVYAREKRELQTRLAEALRRIALGPQELAALPNNYAQAVASGEFGRDYDPAHLDVPGVQTSRIPPERVTNLLKEFDGIHFFDLKEKYFETCTDMPTAIISILWTDGTKK